MTRPPVYAIDIGGTKTLSALVDGKEGPRSPPDRNRTRRQGRKPGSTPLPLRLPVGAGQFTRGRRGRDGTDRRGMLVGAQSGHPAYSRPLPRWSRPCRPASALPVTAVNDAQAAAWGEYRFGAGRGVDMIFVTVSTGIGGGIVSGGQLLMAAVVLPAISAKFSPASMPAKNALKTSPQAPPLPALPPKMGSRRIRRR